MKYTIIAITCLLLLIYSCKGKKSNIVPEKEISFDIGFNYSSSGTYYDKSNSTEYLFFADHVSKKCIKIFDMNGKQIDSIPLKEATKLMEDINRITIVSPDTILINSMHTNQIIIIDRKGRCWKNLNLDTLMNDKKGNHFEMACSGQNILNNGSLLFRCYWNYNSVDQKNKTEPENNLEYLNYYYLNCFNSAHFILLSDIFSEQPHVTFVQEGFYKNLSSSADIFSESPNYSILNNSVFDYSVYSDCLFKTDPNSYEIEKIIHIKSDYTTIGIKPISINSETIQHIQDIMNTGYRTKGFITKAFFNIVDKEYYVLVFHEIKKEDQPIQDLYRDFSVIIYDDTFADPREYSFNTGKYKSGYALMTRKGLMMPIKNNSENKMSDGKTVFALFSFN